MTKEDTNNGRVLPVGTKVHYDGTGESEFGIVVYCWMSEEIFNP